MGPEGVLSSSPARTSAQPPGHPKDCCWVTWQYLKKHYCAVQFGDETGDAATKSQLSAKDWEALASKLDKLIVQDQLLWRKGKHEREE